jgi:hypothetical protein
MSTVTTVRRVPRLTRAEFAATCLHPPTPVIITDDQSVGADARTWTFASMRARWGHERVEAAITPGGEWNYQTERHTVSFAEIVDAAMAPSGTGPRISGTQMNLQTNIRWASEGMRVPPFVPPDQVASSNLWLQSTGDKTHLHWDAHMGAFALIQGESIALFVPSDWASLYPIGSGFGINWSRGCVFVGMRRSFRVADAIHSSHACAGEMLFCPPPGGIVCTPPTSIGGTTGGKNATCRSVRSISGCSVSIGCADGRPLQYRVRVSLFSCGPIGTHIRMKLV